MSTAGNRSCITTSWRATSSTSCVISGTGLHVPPATIDNAELVTAFNRYVEQENLAHAEEIAAGRRAALQPSSVEFILKASGIQRRHVVDKFQSSVGFSVENELCQDGRTK